MTSTQNLFSRIRNYAPAACALALLAASVFMLQAWQYAHTLQSNLDEGAYLYKGYLFASGRYALYQPYGPWSNHMPLAFLIPGAVQVLFGPSLAVGRYFALLLAGLMLLGSWLLTRRLAGKWWAAAALWAFALNPALIKMYSTAVSQGLTACLFTWTLVLVTGEKRPLWQLALGSAFASLLMLTRINMLLVLPIVVLYILWQYGWKAGLVAALAGGGVLVVGHAAFWPGILQLWARLPSAITPFLDPWRLHGTYTQAGIAPTSRLSQVLSALLTLRYHFTVVVGVLAAWLLWPGKEGWRSPAAFRTAVFLSTLFLTLLLLHAWATMFDDYCTYCLPGYLAFFGVSGLLLAVLAAPAWRTALPWWRQLVVVALILVASAGIGYGAFEDISQGVLATAIPRALVDFPRLTPGLVSLSAVLANKFTLDEAALRRLDPTLTGLVGGLAVLLVAALGSAKAPWLRRRLTSPRAASWPSFGYRAMALFLVVGALLSPSPYLGGGKSQYDCGGDVLQGYREVGEFLSATIPAGSQAYWQGGMSAAPLLHAPLIGIYPAQINDGFNYFLDGDPEPLLRVGLWNRALSQQWLAEADYILVEESQFKGKLKETLRAGGFKKLATSPAKVACQDDSEILIFVQAR